MSESDRTMTSGIMSDVADTASDLSTRIHEDGTVKSGLTGDAADSASNLSSRNEASDNAVNNDHPEKTASQSSSVQKKSSEIAEQTSVQNAA